jgi:hypothetical protein
MKASHAEVYSDGAVFYIGNLVDWLPAGAPARFGIVEAHNYRTMAVCDAVFGPGVSDGHWTRREPGDWGDDNLSANYLADDAALVCVYEWTGPGQGAEMGRMGCPPGRARALNAHGDATTQSVTLDGWTVMLCRGEDGTMLVQVDSPSTEPDHAREHDPDGTPRARIYLNDADEPLYENPRYDGIVGTEHQPEKEDPA